MSSLLLDAVSSTSLGHLPRGGAATRLSRVLDARILDEIYRDMARAVEDFDVVNRDYRLLIGGEGIAGDLAALNLGTNPRRTIYDAYASGWSVVLLGADRFSSALARLAGSIATASSTRVHANCYLAPPNSVGAATHRDDHDVLVLQIAGEKCWTLGDNDQEEHVLVAGDAMFISRGVAHSTHTRDLASTHVSVGFNAAQSIALTRVFRRVVNKPFCTEPVLSQHALTMSRGVIWTLHARCDGRATVARIEHYLNPEELSRISTTLRLLRDLSATEIDGLLSAHSILDVTSRARLARLLVSAGCADVERVDSV